MKKYLKILFCMSLLAFVLGIGNVSASAEEVYDVWVGSTQVTSSNRNRIDGMNGGYASYDPDTKTLTLHDLKDVDHSRGWLINSFDDLNVTGTANFGNFVDTQVGICSYGKLSISGNINIKSLDNGLYGEKGVVISGNDTVVKVAVSYYGSRCIYSDKGDVNIKAGKTTLTVGQPYDICGIYANNTIISGGELNIEEIYNGICCEDGSITISGGNTNIDSSLVGLFANTIAVSGGKTKVSGIETAVKAKNAIKLSNGTAIISPEGGKIIQDNSLGCKVVSDADGKTATIVEFVTEPVKYPVWVGALQVTSDNKDRIPGKNGGYASYDPETKTLTFYNFKDVKDEAEYLVYAKDDLNIKGTASFSEQPYFDMVGIRSDGKLSVSGNISVDTRDRCLYGMKGIVVSGKDTVVDVTANVFPCSCIYSEGVFELKDGKVSCYSMMDESTGILAQGVVISGGILDISVERGEGIYVTQNKALDIKGGKVNVYAYYGV